MDSDNRETLRQQDDATNKILEAIAGLRGEMNQRFEKIESEVGEMNPRFEKVEREVGETNRHLFKLEREVGEMKDLQLSFDVRLDRLESMAHESLQVAYSVRADVKVLRAEVTAWAGDVTDLQRKVA